MKIVLTTFITFLIMSAYSLIIKLYHKASGMGLLSGQDMNRVAFSVVAIIYSQQQRHCRLFLMPVLVRRRRGTASPVEASPHYQDGQFHNQLPTPGFTGRKNMLAAWWDFLMTNGKTPVPRNRCRW